MKWTDSDCHLDICGVRLRDGFPFNSLAGNLRQQDNAHQLQKASEIFIAENR